MGLQEVPAVTREELLEALLVERFQPPIPSTSVELRPATADIERRRRDLRDAHLRLVTDNTRRTA